MCGCTKRAQQTYTWTSADGSISQTYSSEVQAKAKVIRKGGTYVPTGQQTANVNTPA